MITLLALTAALVTQASPSIDDVIQKNLEDASFRARITYKNQNELQKINKDFPQMYALSFTDVMVKEPNKLRLTGTAEDTQITYIMNGAIQVFRVPRVKINTKVDLSKSPGKRQSSLDYGLLTPSLFKGTYFQSKFVRVDRASGEYVFDLTYAPVLDDSSRHRVWVDKDKKFTTKREWYGQSGRLRATFLYSEPVLIDKVWLPTKLSVRNIDNVRAGETKYENLKVNSGLADTLFKVD